MYALAFTAAAAALLAFAVLEGSSDSDVIGLASLPIAAVGTILTLSAIVRRSSRSVLAILSGGIALAYWGSVVAMIVPKHFAA